MGGHMGALLLTLADTDRCVVYSLASLAGAGVAVVAGRAS